VVGHFDAAPPSDRIRRLAARFNAQSGPAGLLLYKAICFQQTAQAFPQTGQLARFAITINFLYLSLFFRWHSTLRSFSPGRFDSTLAG